MQPKDTVSENVETVAEDKSTTNNRDLSKALLPLKIVIRHLPPTLTEDTFIEQVAPLPEHDYFDFVKGDASLGQSSFSRAYLNFCNQDELYIFTEKFDGYVFVDTKGNEFPAIVEYAPFQKVPKKKVKKSDSRKGTIEQDPDYVKFVESLTSKDENEVALTLEQVLEEIEAKQRATQESAGKVSTPLIDYLKRRREEKKLAKEDRRKRDDEKRALAKKREDERRRRRDKERESSKYKDYDYEKTSDDKTKRDFNEPESPTKSLKVLKKDEEPDSPKDRKPSLRSPPSAKFDSGRFTTKKPSSWRENDYSGKRETDTAGAHGDTTGAREKDRDTKSARDRDKDRLSARDAEYEKRDSREKRDRRDYDYKDKRDSREKQYGDYKESGKNYKAKRDYTYKEYKRNDYKEKDYRETDYKDDYKENKSSKYYDDSRDRERERRDERERKEKQRKERERREQVRADRDKADKPSTQETSGDVDSEEKSKSRPDSATSRDSVERSVRQLKSEDSERRGSADNSSDSGKDIGAKTGRLRYKDRPERQIYNPAQRAAERKRQQTQQD